MGIQAIDRAAAVLGALRGARHLGISELSAHLGLAPSTVHGIVRSLLDHGLVAKEPGSQRYMLGPALLALSHTYLDAHEVRARAMQWTRELARRTGCSTRLGIAVGTEVLVVHHNRRPDGSQQMYETGLSLPAHASALGKVLLAFDDTFAAAALAKPLRPLTGETVTDPATLRAELAEIALAAIAVERDEGVIGESAIAAPITDRSGAVVAAVEVVMPTVDEGPDQEVVTALRETARTVSREVGGTWPPTRASAA